ncbi:hypothetical protein Cpir12675_004611 [Ceratocystis pirilliformis]|uniref:GRIP domain-containing protein n=1 Tax=Ceratocystis pirilliformis TaxID=259994 RepID=A0ABR3YX19_9PEZI
MSPAPSDTVSALQASGTGKKKNNKKKSKNAKSKDATSIESQPAAEDAPKADAEVMESEPEPSTPMTQEIPIRPASQETTFDTSNAKPNGTNPNPHPDPALQAENQAPLQDEVEKLRSQLSALQESHDAEVAQLKEDIDESTAAKEQAEEQYEALRDRVEKIKSTLAERLQRDRVELEEAKERIDELEAQGEELRGQTEEANKRVESLELELQEATRELTGLRSRNNLSAQNWSKEKEDLMIANQRLRDELQSTTNAMSEWEVIAMEERALKDSYVDKITSLEEQLGQLNEAYLSINSIKDTQDQSISSLQRALSELQDTRKRELRDMVETHEEQLKALKVAAQKVNKQLAAALAEKETLSRELQRTAPFEKEVNEKNLLIGKLRHEAIVLNEHLTKALRYLKKTKPQDQVDRQIVTNQLVHFLSLDRSDPKRFQILQVMASYLQFTDEEREQAGLARPGTSSNSLRLPASPFSRTPSSPSLHSDFFSDPSVLTATTGASSKETLAELWANFLERSAEEGGGPAGGKGRQGSVSSVGTRSDTRG